ncbi:MAG: glycosyltransferase family 1 protein [Bacteroidetes bacterium]|nr:glycosyltransferase family 1 protein [Bacteroidota bacterium]
MANKTLHIVAFDMPYPPEYGGVIDIFFKIKALHEMGAKIILHVFLYAGKEPSRMLEQLCTKVYYYPRRRFKNPFSGELPYIVATRNDADLLRNLRTDQHPILFEGLHSTSFLPHPALRNRFKIVRTHNVEHTYYRALEDSESSFFKKYFFRIEAERLEKYEPVLRNAQCIAAISPSDTGYYDGKFGNTRYLPAFHSNMELLCKPGKGKFVLYHGNMGVGENNKAALYLVHEVFPQLELPCIIAGNNPSRQLQQAVSGQSHISLADHISSGDILKLVQEAQVNVMVTFQNTGIKLKLLNSLHRGRHCVANTMMVENTGLESLVQIGDSADELVKLIKQCWKEEFTPEMLSRRKEGLAAGFDNLTNARKLLDWLV